MSFDVKVILIFLRLHGVVSILLATQRIKGFYMNVIQSMIHGSIPEICGNSIKEVKSTN